MTTISFLGTPGFVRDPESYPRAKLLEIIGQNSGNLAFQYASATLFDADYRFIGHSGIPYGDPNGWVGSDFVVFPAANHLRRGADWSGLCRYFMRAKCPLIVLGLGAQAGSNEREQDVITEMLGDRNLKAFCDVLRDRGALITVRGEFSRRVCEAFGLKSTLVLGCPSAMINKDPFLGSLIEARLQAAASSRFFPVSVTAASALEIAKDKDRFRMERELLQHLFIQGGTYVQQSGGLTTIDLFRGIYNADSAYEIAVMRKAIAPKLTDQEFVNRIEKYGNFFTDAREWIKHQAMHSLSVGSRLHGNMLALAGGTPGVIVPHDTRTLELSEVMHIPTLKSEVFKPGRSLHDCLERVEFSGAKFDRWRRDAALQLVTTLNSIGLPPSNGLQTIAKG
jgi:hypothetical protein